MSDAGGNLEDFYTEVIQPGIDNDGTVFCSPSCPSFIESEQGTKCKLTGRKHPEWYACKPFTELRRKTES